ncbi:fimbrial protein [Serratia silvae]|uniref:Fimbrial protein n=1 Tax=Serratia silvae TaxID=2824122 RepID=A0ABT0KA73_9GAMM|nr:fimbrial protein [Serratia silvae]MCL1028817.1 fimbrial protein [Serratia silvae]
MKGTVTLHRLAWRTLAGLLTALPMLALAAGSGSITIKVTVLAPLPCVINDDRPIEVWFGDDLLTSKIDGSNYLKSVDYSLDCKANTKNAMKLKVEGNATNFERSALKTNMPDLGIALKADGSALTINNWVNFNYPDKPVLQAVPVKRPGTTLSGGDFTSTATLMVGYQ